MSGSWRRARLAASCLAGIVGLMAGLPALGVFGEAEVEPGKGEYPLALDDEEFEDLRFLATVLEGKRIVQLGENTHGVHEYNVAKSRLVRYLHQELGYSVLAFESSVYQCYDAGLTAATAEAATTLRRCAFGVWHTPTLVDLFEYVKRTQDGPHPLRLAGFDVQPIGSNKADRPQFLERIVGQVDTDYAVEVGKLDTRFLEIYGQGGSQRRAFYRSADGSGMASAYERLERFLEEHRTTLEAVTEDPEALGIGIRTAASMADYIRFHAAPSNLEYSEGRDRGMAENLIRLLDEVYPDQKAIVWGHNFHLRHRNAEIVPREDVFPGVPARTMGTWVSEHYGEQVYTVGLYAYQGQAADNRGRTFEITPAAPESLEGTLHARSEPVLFVDFSSRAERTDAAWFSRPMTARFNATVPQELVPSDQYDGVLFFDRVTPRRPLDPH